MPFIPITSEEQDALLSLQQVLATSDRLHEFPHVTSLPQIILLRFLRGRKGVIKDAAQSIIRHLQWRQESGIDNISVVGIESVIASRKAYLHRTDKLGNPAVYIFARRHSLYERTVDEMRQFIFYTLEQTMHQAKADEQRIVLVFDLASFSLSCMDYEVLKVLAATMQFNYPDILDAAFIVNAPWIFSACWTVLKSSLDPVTVLKIKFVSPEELPEFFAAGDLPEDLQS